jgi:hypothetical protein
LGLAVASVAIGATATVIASAAFESLVVLAVGVVATLLFAIRGARVSVVADHSQIVVRNQFRTYRIRWEDVTHVGISITSSVAAQFTAVVLREKSGRAVAAQATTSGGREQRRVIRALSALRPDLRITYSE